MNKWHRLNGITVDGIGLIELMAATSDDGIGVIARWTMREDSNDWHVEALDTESERWRVVTEFHEGETVPPTPPTEFDDLNSKNLFQQELIYLVDRLGCESASYCGWNWEKALAMSAKEWADIVWRVAFEMDQDTEQRAEYRFDNTPLWVIVKKRFKAKLNKFREYLCSRLKPN